MMVVKILILCTFVNTERNFFKYHRVFPMLLKKEPLGWSISPALGWGSRDQEQTWEERTEWAAWVGVSAEMLTVGQSPAAPHSVTGIHRFQFYFIMNNITKQKFLIFLTVYEKQGNSFNYHYFMSLTYYLIIRKIQNYKQNQI